MSGAGSLRESPGRPHPDHADLADLRADLRARAADIATRLRGQPNPSLSTRRSLRFGSRGSLSVEIAGPRAGLWHDHETRQGGDLLALIQREHGCDFPTALAEARALLGGAVEAPPPLQPERAMQPAHSADTAALARQVWREAVPAAGTAVEAYLAGRGLVLPPAADVLRYHPACPRGRDRLPAMVALMTSPETNQPTGIHRTFIRADGAGKAGVTPAKQMLGPAGVIRLVDDAEITIGLGIAEGVETSLAILGAGWSPVWACGSAGAIGTFPLLGGIESVTIFADRDEAGMTAARACAERWAAAGRDARIISPRAGGDWNDAMRLAEAGGAP